MPIRERIIQVKFYYDDQIYPEKNVEKFSLFDIDSEINEGDMIGQTEVISDELVSENEIESRLKAIGNDGTFFSNEIEI